jgi:protein-tyrosine phosphatase
MIDLHCHLLPGIDDGARDMKESLALARLAYTNGIRKAIVTPHIYPGRYNNDANNIRKVFTTFKQTLQDYDIPLQVGMAAEVRICPEIPMMLEQNLIPFLGYSDGYSILLLELPYQQIPLGSDKIINWLLQRKIRPLIAHPERNGEIVSNLKKVQPFIELGCWLQLTAASVVGYFGNKTQQCSHQLLEKGWVSVIATDAHNQEFRPPDLASGRIAAARIVGDTAAWALVREIPAQITRAQFEI